MKNYSLCIFGPSRFALSNDTDSDPYTDYNPGIWGITSQKSVLKMAAELIAEGNNVRVMTLSSDHMNNLANDFIKKLGINQPLLEVLPSIPANSVSKVGVPNSLASLRRAMIIGRVIRVINYDNDGAVIGARNTSVAGGNTSGMTVLKGDRNSWIYWGRASDWSFDDNGATLYYRSKKTMRIEYDPVNYGSVMVGGLHNAVIK